MATADRDRRRLQRIHRALQMYRGDQPKPLRVLPGEPDDNMRINMAGLVVDTGVDALFGQDVPIEIVDDADQVDTEVTDYLDTVWGMNGGMLLWQAVATNGAVSGHAALRIVPAAEG